MWTLVVSDQTSGIFHLLCLCTNTAVMCDPVGLSNALRWAVAALCNACLPWETLGLPLQDVCSLQPCSVSFATFLQTVDALIGCYRGPARRLLLIYNNLFELWVVQSYSGRMWFLWKRAVDALYSSFNQCFSPLGSPVSSSVCDQESKGNTQRAPPESLQ